MGFLEFSFSTVLGILLGCLGVWWYWKKQMQKAKDGLEEIENDKKLFPPEGNPDLTNKDWKVEDSEEHYDRKEDEELTEILLRELSYKKQDLKKDKTKIMDAVEEKVE